MLTRAPDKPGAVYVAAAGFEADLEVELARKGVRVLGRRNRLLLCDGPARPMAWAQNAWLAPRWLEARSVKQAADQLRALQRNWALHESACGPGLYRRAQLIVQALPHVSRKPLEFGRPAPDAPLGAWTLWDQDRILASPACSSPFADGEPAFVEDKTGPPSRAYLKLWEAFTLLPQRPGPGETCLDLGSAPGGWTWALARLGARVLSIDKAPLAPQVLALPGVEYRPGSAFAVRPQDAGPVDWLCSDVICYPDRLLRLARAWLDADAARHFVCTVKFQGTTDHAAMAAFEAIPGSRLLHLAHNKHELTWVRLGV